jgi:hypothetical protein
LDSAPSQRERKIESWKKTVFEGHGKYGKARNAVKTLVGNRVR